MPQSLKGLLPKNSYAMAKKKSKKLKTGSLKSEPVLTPPAPAQQKLTGKERPNVPHAPIQFATLTEIAETLRDCKRCKLCEKRTTVVVGEGNPRPELLFVGEGPGENEDLTGRPFVGRGGQLLDKMIEAMGKKREDVFIANVVKCRPPENRAPEPDEVEQCIPFLFEQIRLLKPKVIVALGATAAKNLLSTDTAIGKLRGTVHDLHGTRLIATFHPAYLLRNPPAKKDAWEDLKLAMKELGWKAKT